MPMKRMWRKKVMRVQLTRKAWFLSPPLAGAAPRRQALELSALVGLMVGLHPEAWPRLGVGVRRVDVMVVFASDLDFEARAAASVTGDDGRAFWIGAVSVTPLHEPQYSRHQVHAFRRDHVLEPAARAGLAVCLGGQDALLDEFAQPLGEQVARTSQGALKVAKTG
jgi:hypothetical protein